MTAEDRGGEPRRGESDGTSSISRASDDCGFPRMPGEDRRAAPRRGESSSISCASDARGCPWMPVDARGCPWMTVDARGCPPSRAEVK